MTPLFISIAVFVITLVAEALHARRVVKMRTLIFPSLAFRRERLLNATLLAAVLLRCVAASGFSWGLLTLWSIPPIASAAEDLPDGKVDPTKLRHIILVLDISPSMAIADSGEHGNLSRARQAGAVLMNALSQLDMRYARVSVVAFFTDAKPVVIDTVDPNIVKNFVSGLPLINAFEDGETNLMTAITRAFDLAAPWEKDSTSILFCTDGDSVPLTGMPKPPASIHQILFAGVGDPTAGTFIDGHFSRQDTNGLRQIATRLHGEYFNISNHWLPPDLLQSFTGILGKASPAQVTGLRMWSIFAIAAASVIFLLLPAMQAVFDLWSRSVSRPNPSGVV